MKYEGALFAVSFAVACYLWIFKSTPWWIIAIYWTILALKNYNDLGGNDK